MTGRLDGKVALVTGAGRGQGRSHAIRLAEEGADIVAVDVLEDVDGLGYPLANAADRDETVAAVESTGRHILFEKADVRDLARLREVAGLALARFGRVDIVVANAGAGSPAPTLDMSEETFTDAIDRFLISTWRTVRAFAPVMIEAGRGGSIVLISSTSGLVGVPGMAHYVAAKHGVTGLMKALAIDLGPFDIRVNAVASSNVNTPMIHNPMVRAVWAGDVAATEAEVVRAMAAMHILDVPWVEPVDVSHAVLWLASDEARYVTGSTIPVDAGAMAPFKIPHRTP